MIPISEAFALISETVRPIGVEIVPLQHAVGRVLHDDVVSDVDSPPHDKSVMDGYAVRSDDITTADVRLEVVETIVAGGWPTKTITQGQSARIMTGAPLPEGADAVVMIEQTESFEADGSQWVTIKIDSLDRGRHVMRKATSMACGKTVFTTGHRIRPTDIGLLAEVGAHEIRVARRPQIAVLPTGDELVTAQQRPGPGQIRNSNGPMLIAMVQSLGMEVKDLGIGRDDPQQLELAIAGGLESDLLILSGGVSAGILDLVPGILAKRGVRQIFHQVAVKPGKPIWFGVLNRDERSTYVFGLPGNPVSSLVGFRLFVQTAIERMVNSQAAEPFSVAAELVSAHKVRGNRPTYWPGRWVNSEKPMRQVEPLDWQGSSDLRALGLANVLIYFHVDHALHPAGEIVQVIPIS